MEGGKLGRVAEYSGDLNYFEQSERRRFAISDSRAVRYFFYGKVTYRDVFDVKYERLTCIKIFNDRTLAYKFNNETETVGIAPEMESEPDDSEGTE